VRRLISLFVASHFMDSEDMAPPRTSNAPRGTVQGTAYHGLVKLTIRAAPLPEDILRFILDNTTTLKQLQQERRTGDALSFDNVDDMDDEEGANIQGSAIRKPRVRPEDFWDALQQICEAAGGEWKDVAERLWSSGPQRAGGCLLIDARRNHPQS
jgi:ribosome assembly protein 1